MSPHTLDDAVQEAVRLTVWRNVRRYVILGGIAFVIFDLIVTLTVVILIAIDTRDSDKSHAQVACRNTATIALIQRVTVAQQSQNTDSLVRQGFTFGIPKGQFDKLYAKSKRQQQEFIAALDALAKANCTSLTMKQRRVPRSVARR